MYQIKKTNSFLSPVSSPGWEVLESWILLWFWFYGGREGGRGVENDGGDLESFFFLGGLIVLFLGWDLGGSWVVLGLGWVVGEWDCGSVNRMGR